MIGIFFVLSLTCIVVAIVSIVAIVAIFIKDFGDAFLAFLLKIKVSVFYSIF